ncbi:hypothetical protein MHYP_G00349480 [Metynnis hypsauchen]
MASSGMGGGRNGRDPSSSGPGFYSEHKIKQAKPLRRPEELRGSLRRLDLKVLGSDPSRGPSCVDSAYRRGDERTPAIARLRIIVERVTGRVKEFHIFDSETPLTLAGSTNQTPVNCCLLVSYQGPLALDPH